MFFCLFLKGSWPLELVQAEDWLAYLSDLTHSPAIVCNKGQPRTSAALWNCYHVSLELPFFCPLPLKPQTHVVPSSLIPGKKLLIEITKQCFTSPWENCIEKLTGEGETLSPGEGIQMAEVGQNPWGAWDPSLLLQTTPWPAQLFCTLPWAMTAHCIFSLWHFIAFCTHVFPWLCDVCLSPSQRLYAPSG